MTKLNDPESGAIDSKTIFAAGVTSGALGTGALARFMHVAPRTTLCAAVTVAAFGAVATSANVTSHTDRVHAQASKEVDAFLRGGGFGA